MTKGILQLIIFCFVVSFSIQAEAARSKANKSKTKAKAAASSNLSTDIVFESQSIHGRYQYGDEAVVNVENEKLLWNLLGVRKDFKDRLLAATKVR